MNVGGKMTENKIEIDLDEITKYMDELKQAKAKFEFDLKQVNAEIEKTEKILESLLEQLKVDEMLHGVYRFGWKTTTKRTFDQKKFKTDNPEVYEQYKTEKQYKNFEFKINN